PAIRQSRQITRRRAIHADVALNVVVPGCELFITERPGDAMTIARILLEVQRRHPVTVPPPHEGPPSEVVAANPAKLTFGRCFVDIHVVVHEHALGPLVRAGEALNALGGGEHLRVRKAPERQLPRRLELGRVILAMLDPGTPLEQQHAQAALGELLGGPAAGDPGARDDRIVFAHHSAPPKSSLERLRYSGVSTKLARRGPGTGS